VSDYSAEPILGKNSPTWAARDSYRMLDGRATIRRMAAVLHPWQILVAAFAGWITRQQDAVIEYLGEENRVL
jgi:hypothetical protein